MLARTPIDQARADRALKAAKAFEFAKTNSAPSCKWSGQHLTSQYGNWCSMCGTDMPPPHFYPKDDLNSGQHVSATVAAVVCKSVCGDIRSNTQSVALPTAQIIDFPLTEADLNCAGFFL